LHSFKNYLRSSAFICGFNWKSEGWVAMQETLLQREKWLIVSVLLALSGVAWVFSVYQTGAPTGPDLSLTADRAMPSAAKPEPSHEGMTMPGMTLYTGSTPMDLATLALEGTLFLVMWVAMMIAMMFPSVYPMVLLYARVSKGRSAQPEGISVPTWIFVAGYLVIWTLFGALAYPTLVAMRALGTHLSWLQNQAPIISGVVLVGVGCYQFSRWKSVCLTHCRSPLSFILHQWREGVAGAFRMGVGHGAYCVGCCWGLMIVLLTMGLMNLAWMGLLTVAIFLEKVSQYGATLSKVSGGVLILLGIVMLIAPELMGFA